VGDAAWGLSAWAGADSRPLLFQPWRDCPSVRLPASAIFLVLCLGGCLEGGDGATDRGDGGVLAVDTQAWPTTLAGPGGDAETSLAVSHDGQTVLVCAHGGFTQASPLWASTDAGETYRRIEPEPNQPFNGDCDVAITEDGAWHIVYDTIASATYASSADDGDSWWVHPFTALPVGGVDRPWLLALGNDVALVWADVMSALPFLGFHMRTSDHGRTWSTPTVLGTFTPDAGLNCFLGHPILSPSQALQVPIVCGDNGPISVGPVFILESRDDGDTWDRFPTNARSGGSIAASYAGDGGLWLTVSEPDGNGNAHGAVHSTDEGRTFSEPLWFDHEVTAGFGWFWVDGRPDGSATAAWMDDGPEEGTWQVSIARLVLDDGAPAVLFSGPVGPVGTDDPLYEFLMVRHDGSGRAFVSMPQKTGEECFEAGDLPSQVGSGGTRRNQQCVLVVREPVASTA
jgi:hypothetical protein